VAVRVPAVDQAAGGAVRVDLGREHELVELEERLALRRSESDDFDENR
jgi:hypothetical protein